MSLSGLVDLDQPSPDERVETFVIGARPRNEEKQRAQEAVFPVRQGKVSSPVRRYIAHENLASSEPRFYELLATP